VRERPFAEIHVCWTCNVHVSWTSNVHVSWTSNVRVRWTSGYPRGSDFGEGTKKKRAAAGGHGALRGQQKKGAEPHRAGSAVAAMAASAYRDNGVKAWECKVRSRDPGKCWPRGRVLKAKPRGRVLKARPRNPGQR